MEEPARAQSPRAERWATCHARAATPIRLLRPLDLYASQNPGVATNGGGAGRRPGVLAAASCSTRWWRVWALC